MLYYNLSQEVRGENVISDIKKLISNGNYHNLSDYCLVISLQKITDYAGDSLLPKITYKADSLT